MVCVLSEDCSWKSNGPAPRGPADRTDPPQIFPDETFIDLCSKKFSPKSFLQKVLSRKMWGGSFREDWPQIILAVFKSMAVFKSNGVCYLCEKSPCC